MEIKIRVRIVVRVGIKIIVHVSISPMSILMSHWTAGQNDS